MNFAKEFPFLEETLTGVLNFATLLDLKLGNGQGLALRQTRAVDCIRIVTANESFKKGQNFVANIKVVNDAAERTVKLYSDYAAILTEHEDQ